jgi:hypothetical protein
MDHRSSNPDKPLADAGGAVPEAGALFDAAEVGVRATGVGVDVVGESGCDDVQRVFCTGVGDIVAAKDWGCLLFVAEESGFSGELKTGGEVVLWACDDNVGLTADVDAGRRFVAGGLFSISIRVGPVADEVAEEEGEGAAWKSAKSSSVEMSARRQSGSQDENRTVKSSQVRQCLVGAGGVGGGRYSIDRRIIKATQEIDLWFLLLWGSWSRLGLCT